MDEDSDLGDLIAEIGNRLLDGANSQAKARALLTLLERTSQDLSPTEYDPPTSYVPQFSGPREHETRAHFVRALADLIISSTLPNEDIWQLIVSIRALSQAHKQFESGSTPNTAPVELGFQMIQGTMRLISNPPRKASSSKGDTETDH